MSVSVEDLLHLPSLRHAEVVAGHGGLQKIVSSISVLEGTDPDILNDALFHNDAFYGSEIVITGFLNITGDPEKQCQNLRRLAEGGEVGLILYYVGYYLKEIHPTLISLANALDFPLICMPRNRVDLRYSEVIADVMRAIFQDQHASTSMAVEILERVARLPQHQQTVDTVMKMLSDRLRATVILSDAARNVLNEAAWPRTLGGLHTTLAGMDIPEGPDDPTGFPTLPNGLLYHTRIASGGTERLSLFVIRDGEPLGRGELQQAAESIQLALSLWSQRHEQTAIAELVRAILQDEPLKMRRLADLFKIDIASVHVMWVYTGGPFTREHAEVAAGTAARFCRTAFSDIHDDSLVLFMDGPDTAGDAHLLMETLSEQQPRGHTLTTFQGLVHTTSVREAFLTNSRHLPDVRRMLPQKRQYQGNDLLFAARCRQRIAAGESAVTDALLPLRALDGKRDADALFQTLAVYLLDENGSVPATAERLYLHKNTVKYRLRVMSDCFGFAIGQMPASAPLYEAVAIRRLLGGEEKQPG